jgi:hypothetical protein
MYLVRAATLALVIASIVPRVAAAETVQLLQFNTKSAIQITAVRAGYRQASRRGSDVAQSVCVSFGNTDPRAVKQVTFHFVYYDTLDNHAGEADLVRTGTFAKRAVIDSVNEKVRTLNMEDCVVLPYHQQGIAVVVAFVKAVTFADGSVWTTPGPEIPEHLGAPAPGTSPTP